MRIKNSNKKTLLFIIILNLSLILAVLGLMQYVQFLLHNDVQISLSEIVTQNKDVITSKLKVELNNVELYGQQIADRIARENIENTSDTKQMFLKYAQEKDQLELIISDVNGNAISGSGIDTKITGRQYFQTALKGQSNISERIVSRINGEDIFVLSVPFYLNNEIVGTIQKQYTPQEMYDLCSTSLFSKQGNAYIINSDGYILITSENNQYNKESDNYYRILHTSDSQAALKLEADIKKNISGFMETRFEEINTFFAYTPIEEIHGWYLISSIVTNAVSPNSEIVVQIFYVILCTVSILFGISLLYYWYIKRKQQMQLESIAFVDNVTKGDSFTKFIYDLPVLLKQNDTVKYYIYEFDIDNFKYINRYYSFEAGDRILKSIYDLHQAQLKEDERMARINGDQFVMLLSDVSDKRMEELYKHERTIDQIKIYISAGIYPITQRNENVNLMIDKASIASKQMKGRHFKSVAWYTNDLDKNMVRNEQLKRELEQALEEKQIIPFFQPKVDVTNRKLVGAEALARWKSKDGMVSPAEFIPICEQTGLISLVDMSIFEQTLAFIKENLDQGNACVPISINFSRMHLINSKFVQTLVDKLEEYQVPSDLIEIELTETIIFDNHHTIDEFINQLHHHNLKISMDDFGSGYSSLHMLKDVDIDIIKIDRGFLMGSSEDVKQKTVFGSIVQMANKLDMKVVVEGVETLENVELMKEFNCHIAQGYYFSKPVDKELFQKIYEKGIIEQ